ncbi:hypothetical protein D3C79_1104960 [compost metagenome]
MIEAIVGYFLPQSSLDADNSDFFSREYYEFNLIKKEFCFVEFTNNKSSTNGETDKRYCIKVKE